jgi:hypothetical protein
MPRRKLPEIEIGLTPGDCEVCLNSIDKLKCIFECLDRLERAGIDVTSRRQAAENLLKAWEAIANEFIPGYRDGQVGA